MSNREQDTGESHIPHSGERVDDYVNRVIVPFIRPDLAAIVRSYVRAKEVIEVVSFVENGIGDQARITALVDPKTVLSLREKYLAAQSGEMQLSPLDRRQKRRELIEAQDRIKLQREFVMERMLPDLNEAAETLNRFGNQQKVGMVREEEAREGKRFGVIIGKLLGLTEIEQEVEEHARASVELFAEIGGLTTLRAAAVINELIRHHDLREDHVFESIAQVASVLGQFLDEENFDLQMFDTLISQRVLVYYLNLVGIATLPEVSEPEADR